MKIADSYQSVIRGVSNQVPQDRFPGQCYEQVNLISDVVRGLARRHGSVRKGEVRVSTGTNWAGFEKESEEMRVYTTHADTREIDVIYRPNGVQVPLLDVLYAFDKTAGKFLETRFASNDPAWDAFRKGGVSAITSVGRYIFIAGNDLVAKYTKSTPWASTKRYAVVQFRSGQYSRTYSVAVTVGSNSYTATYKTPESSYPVTLDVSNIPLEPTESYNKRINDVQIKHNSEATAWIGKAAEQSQPQYIATKMREGLIAAGMPASMLHVENATLCIDSSGAAVTVETRDGGDGTTIKAADDTVRTANELPNIHTPGKIVRIQPKASDDTDVVYMKAVATKATHSKWCEVRWTEAAGEVIQPSQVFMIATVEGDKLYIASTPALLSSLTGFTTPPFIPNYVGDEIGASMPYFLNKRITYLGLFQDRLVIGSGAVLFFSRPGDYFNWFRSSMLDVRDDDPVEMYALGSEDDVIRHSTTFDRNLILFGRRRQYSVSGRAPLTSRTASIISMSAYEEAVDAPPIGTGNLVFYGSHRGLYSSLHQIQIGLVQDSPESYEVSRPLDTYLRGVPTEITAMTSPNTVLLRTNKYRSGVYVYGYMDTAASQERLFDAWSRWEYSKDCGFLVGASSYRGEVYLYWLRPGKQGLYLVVDSQSLDTELSDRPYIDSQVPYQATPPSSNWSPLTDDNMVMAINRPSKRAFFGAPYSKRENIEQDFPEELPNTSCGLLYEAYITPTNPFRRDRNDKVVTTGRLVVTRFIASVADTGGLMVTVDTPNKKDRVVRDFSGRLTGRATNVIGQAPIVTTSVSAPIGHEARAFTYTIHAKTWLPLTITAIEWVGQYFNNTRR